MKETILYKGSFNWFGEIHELYKYAKSENQAFVFFCRAIGKKTDRNYYVIYNYFFNTNKYLIEKYNT